MLPRCRFFIRKNLEFMFPVRATVVPKVKEGSEFLTINASGIVYMETTAIEETENRKTRSAS
jgi:hypothetical protein